MAFLFLEQSRTNEINLENDYDNFRREFSDLLDYDSYGSIVKVMCEMFTYCDECGLPVTDFVERTDMPDKYRHEDGNETKMSNFLILHDSLLMFTNMVTKYESIEKDINSHSYSG